MRLHGGGACISKPPVRVADESMAATSAEPEQPTDPAPAAEEPAPAAEEERATAGAAGTKTAATSAEPEQPTDSAPAAEEEQATAAGTAGTKTPLRQRIGLDKPRHERNVWKVKDEAPVAVQAKDRNAAMDIKILCGMIDNAVRESVLCKKDAYPVFSAQLDVHGHGTTCFYH